MGAPTEPTRPRPPLTAASEAHGELVIDAERWENGSDFQWWGLPEGPRSGEVPWSCGLLLFSGRDALRLVLAMGAAERGWRRLWVPDYFCQHVLAAMQRPDLEMLMYPDNPLRAAPQLPEARAGDVVFVMNYFGLRTRPDLRVPDGVEIIEDHSHDPGSAWAQGSRADFCVASLRKTLPISDGGVLWSPLGHRLPPAPPLTEQRRRAGATKLSAMMLKAMYLSGLPVEKDRYRALALKGERALAYPAVCAMTEVSRGIVDSFPLDTWRRARRDNRDVLVEAMGSAKWARVLEPAGDSVVFSFPFVVDTSQRRERIRARLIEANVFPTVHWPLEQTVLPVGNEALDISRRLLSIHCDGRYAVADMIRVAEVLKSSAED
jgi:hypothetical protein